MFPNIRTALTLLLLSHALDGLCQSLSFADSVRIDVLFFSTDSLNRPPALSYDTMPGQIRFYDPVTRNFHSFAQQGNIGRAVKNLVPDFRPSTGFSTGITTFDPYRFQANTLPYYGNLYPFSDIYYVMGKNKEQLLDVSHSQPAGKNLTANVRFRVINAPGPFTNQKAEVYNLAVSLRYGISGSRYRATGTFIQNLLRTQENGGITSDSIFENNTEPDRRIIPVNLTGAQQRMRESTGVLWHEYSFLSAEHQDDRPWLSYLPLQLTHTATYREESWVYEDKSPNYSFYPFYPHDSLGSQDEIVFHLLKNRIFLHNADSARLNYAVGAAHEWIRVRNETPWKTFGQVTGFFDARLSLPRQFSLSAGGSQTTGGYNDGDYQSFIRAGKAIGKGKNAIHLAAFTRMTHVTPGWTSQHYLSNYFRWEQDMERVKTTTAGASISFRKLEAGGRFHSLEQAVVFLAGSSVPYQLAGKINISQLYLKLQLRLGKLVLDNRLDYQLADRDTLLSLPEFISHHSVYLDFTLLKGALVLQPGFDLYWQSGYYADAYMPATRTFYLQHDTRLNDQFYADFFINMKVSRARFFVKYQHINALASQYDYYLIPHYPVQDAALKFGICWMLRDLPDRDKKVEAVGKK